MRLGADRVRVSVPATSANLGPGFDTFGLALELRDDIEVRAVSGRTSVHIIGEGKDDLPRDDNHLVVQAIRAGLEHAGSPLVGLNLVCRNRIPHGRGLGSSAAAVVGGLMAARGLLGDATLLDDAAILALAEHFEGHPDNAAPAILGGLTVAWIEEGGPAATRVELDPRVQPIILVPDSTLATAHSRTAVPGRVDHSDAVFNVSRAALFIEAASRSPELMFQATEDALHQGFRREVLGASYDLLMELRTHTFPAVLSGAGPALLVLAAGPRTAIDEAVRSIKEIAGSKWRVGHLPVASLGAQIVTDGPR